MLVCVTWKHLLSKVRDCLATKDSKQWFNQLLCVVYRESGGRIEANTVKFVLKHLACDTFINLKIEPAKYVKYVRNDIGQGMSKPDSL